MKTFTPLQDAVFALAIDDLKGTNCESTAILLQIAVKEVKECLSFPDVPEGVLEKRFEEFLVHKNELEVLRRMGRTLPAEFSEPNSIPIFVEQSEQTLQEITGFVPKA